MSNTRQQASTEEEQRAAQILFDMQARLAGDVLVITDPEAAIFVAQGPAMREFLELCRLRGLQYETGN